MSERTLKVGLVQQSVADNDKATNWNKSAARIAELAEQGAELILLRLEWQAAQDSISVVAPLCGLSDARATDGCGIPQPQLRCVLTNTLGA